MATHKYIGIETEFGIVHRGIEVSNPIAASSLLITAYLDGLDADADPTVGLVESKIDWDFEDESPGRDARGAAPVGANAPEVETHLVNTVLKNGARYYVDHAHPELSTPECADPRSVVVWDRAAEHILARSMREASARLPEGQELVVYKNNSDGKGNSYGCHENYLMDREVPFHQVVTHMIPHFISRQLYTGSGKIGSEVAGSSLGTIPYQLTQRADFFEAEVGLETTLKRPIINTRDEPHADPAKYRRLHVICGDANCSEVATLLKVGTTALLLAMVEDHAMPREFHFRTPVHEMLAVSRDCSLTHSMVLSDGRSITALALQWELFEAAVKYAESFGLEPIGSDAGQLVLHHWHDVLQGLETDPRALADRIDWIAKYRLLDAYRERHGTDWRDSRLAALALQYHDLRPDRSLAARAGLVRVTNDVEVVHAIDHPPEDTRAWFRGACLAKFGEAVVSANWDSMVFDIGAEPLRRVPMMDPGRGTRAQVGSLIEESQSAAELIARLGA